MKGLSAGTIGFSDQDLIHFGLGDATEVVSLTIDLPDGTQPVLASPQINQYLDLAAPR